MPELRLSGIVEESIVDGPGLRFVLFTQGCPHACPGCHNPETHPRDGGFLIDVDTVFAQFAANPLLSGITFSGGEPFLQPGPLAYLAGNVRAMGKTVFCYTGYTFEQLLCLAREERLVAELLARVDTLVDGPYVAALRDPEFPFRGSSNQRLLSREDMLRLASACSPPGGLSDICL